MILRVRDKDGKVQEIPAIVGAKGEQGVSVTEVKQIQTSNVDGGTNIIQVKLSNGQTFQFQVKNGSKGSTPVIDTSNFATLSGYNTFSNSIAAPEFTTTMNGEYKYATYYPNHIYYVDDSEGMGYSSELIFPTSEVGTIATREWVQTNAPSVDTSEFLPIKEPTAYDSFTVRSEDSFTIDEVGTFPNNQVHFYADGQIQVSMHNGETHDCWYWFAEDEIVEDGGGTIATREWAQANSIGGLKLPFIGNLNDGTPTMDLSQYSGFAYEIGFEQGGYTTGEIVYSGILSFSTPYNFMNFVILHFPFTTSDLYNAGIIIDPFGNGGNANEKLYLKIGSDQYWENWVIQFNPFIGATAEDEQAQPFIKLFGLKK